MQFHEQSLRITGRNINKKKKKLQLETKKSLKFDAFRWIGSGAMLRVPRCNPSVKRGKRDNEQSQIISCCSECMRDGLLKLFSQTTKETKNNYVFSEHVQVGGCFFCLFN